LIAGLIADLAADLAGAFRGFFVPSAGDFEADDLALAFLANGARLDFRPD
jgi:hypothetical protein